MVKITNKKALEFVLGLTEVQENEEIRVKLKTMLAQVEKKNKGTDKDGKKVLSATQKENEGTKKVILTVLGELQEKTQIKELAKDERLAKFTPQKLSALVRQLVAERKVVRVEVKRVAMFGLA